MLVRLAKQIMHSSHIRLFLKAFSHNNVCPNIKCYEAATHCSLMPSLTNLAEALLQMMWTNLQHCVVDEDLSGDHAGESEHRQAAVGLLAGLGEPPLWEGVGVAQGGEVVALGSLGHRVAGNVWVITSFIESIIMGVLSRECRAGRQSPVCRAFDPGIKNTFMLSRTLKWIGRGGQCFHADCAILNIASGARMHSFTLHELIQRQADRPWCLGHVSGTKQTQMPD